MKFNTFYKQVGVLFIFVTMSSAFASNNNIPVPFQGEDANSKFTINYDDLDFLLKKSVLNTGKSNRVKAKKSRANIGTRMKVKVNQLSANEGNRFYFEGFKTPEQKNLIAKIRYSLEQLPTDAPLKYFSKDEQFAYWLNLYNVTMLDELIKVYPKRKLKDFLTDSDSILKQKILTVSGVKLSLNDIQYKILNEKFNANPLIIYGLYQGIIGGPNIRNKAYTGEYVYSALKSNANEFINSNRGVYADRKLLIRVSSLYRRNEDYFPHFKTDLKKHLLTYLEGYTRIQLEDSKKIKPNINNWNITDLYGTTRNFGVGVSTNKAALLDSTGKNDCGANCDTAGLSGGSLGGITETIINKTANFGRFTPEEITKLKALNDIRAKNSGHVTITELSEDKK